MKVNNREEENKKRQCLERDLTRQNEEVTRENTRLDVREQGRQEQGSDGVNSPLHYVS